MENISDQKHIYVSINDIPWVSICRMCSFAILNRFSWTVSSSSSTSEYTFESSFSSSEWLEISSSYDLFFFSLGCCFSGFELKLFRLKPEWPFLMKNDIIRLFWRTTCIFQYTWFTSKFQTGLGSRRYCYKKSSRNDI